VRALAADLLHPANPLLALPGSTSPRFTPYTILWALFMKGTGLGVFTVMGFAAVTNFLIFVTGLWRLLTRRFESRALPLYALVALLVLWGRGYAQATAYHLEFLLATFCYNGIFTLGVCLHALADAQRYLAHGSRGAYARHAALMVLAFLAHPITALFGFTATACLAIADRRWRRGARLAAVPALALAAALAWPYFDYWAVLTRGSTEPWFEMPLYRRQGTALGVALFGVPLLVGFALQRRHLFVFYGALACFAIYALSGVLGIRIGGRFLIFTAFFLHLAIALFLEAHDLFGRGGWRAPARVAASAAILLVLFVPAGIRRVAGMRVQLDRVAHPPAGRYFFLQRHLGAGDVVLADPVTSYILPAIAGARAVAQAKGNPLIHTEVERRRADALRFLYEKIPTHARAALLARYGVTHILLEDSRRPAPSLVAHLPLLGVRVASRGGVTLYHVRTATPHRRLPGVEASDTLARSRGSRPAPAAILAGDAMRIRGVNHLALMTRDLDATVRFYSDVLGLELVKACQTFDVPVIRSKGKLIHDGGDLKSPRHYFFDLGDGSLLAFFDGGKDAKIPEGFVRIPGAFHHLSLDLEDEAALLAARREIEARGIAVSDVVDHEFCKSIYLTDPDGRNLELSYTVRRVGGLADLDDPEPIPALDEIRAKLAGEAS
jgi:catechol 2,3-dioxygenase-like lactoylglutathione lyase family enzyme